jgi:small subunit ribosomal protein S6
LLAARIAGFTSGRRRTDAVQKCYETIFIMRPTLNDQEIAELIENYRGILQREGAEMLYQADLGKKKLAYIIRHFQNGHYALYRYRAPAAAVHELERSMKINEDLLRYLTVKLDEKELAAANAAVAAAAAATAGAGEQSAPAVVES